MKNIISDYIYLRMAFCFAVIVLCAASFMFNGFGWITFVIGLLNVFAAFDMAIKIADFEMSDIGDVVSLWESDKASRLDVYLKR